MRPAPVLVCLAAAALLMAGCTDVRRTQPERAAGEQLLISTAADKAAEKLDFGYVAGMAVFVRTANFEGYDEGYAISRIRQSLLQQGARLAESQNLLIGIPSLTLPIPTTESVVFPELALLKEDDRTGIAKFAAIATDVETGALIGTSGPVYGLP